ncbi:MAG TPA: C40 family peptidase [Gaiellaceae bacterium]|nr:C40 family peptidase [Gaiellaceae bacterium]
MRRLLPVIVLPGLLAPTAAQARVDPARVAPVRRQARPVQRVVSFAERQIGVPYRWGGISRRTGFDCSGLVYAAYLTVGRTLPHSTWGQMTLGRPVRFGRLRPGDLVFTNGGDHVQLVVSNRAAVSAPHTGARVRFVSLRSLRGGFVGARRLLR